MRKEQLFLDHLPDDPRHLVAVHLHDGVLYRNGHRASPLVCWMFLCNLLQKIVMGGGKIVNRTFLMHGNILLGK
jgi:hypothetical protein